MFKNYLTIAIRNLVRHKGYSLINIAGLAIGMACCLLIVLYVQYEFSYDRYHENVEQIYRVVDESGAQTPGLMAPALLDDFPPIIHATRIKHFEKALISYGNKRFYEDRVFFADPSVFEVFTFPLIKGNSKTALQAPYSMVITQEMAGKYFGEDDPIGKTITYDNKHDFTITGVLENVPQNSHFKFDFLVSFATASDVFPNAGLDKWNYWSATHTYVLLPKDYPPTELEQQFPDFVIKYLGKGWVESFQTRLHLQPLKQIHLHSNLWGEIEPNSDIKYIYLFSAIAFSILLIACINYMNLSTARYANRAREVGMRKVLGANRIQLIKQFMGESILMAFIALLLAAALMELFLPAFCSLIDRELVVNYLDNWLLLPDIIGIAMFVGIVSGSYPAFYLSAFQPLAVLRKTLQTGLARSRLRRALVVLQFVISVVLIIATIIIYGQLNYIRNRKLGFNKEQVVVLPIRDNHVRQKTESVKNELRQNPNIISATASSYIPGGMKWITSFSWEGQRDDEDNTMGFSCIDHDFIQTFEIELVAGRDFSRDFVTDAKQAFIINEAAVKKTGWNSPIGKRVTRFYPEFVQGSVIGVIKDFHLESLYKTIKPLVLLIDPEGFQYLSVRIRPNDIPGTLDFIKKKWTEFSPNRPFEYFFLDNYFDKLYKAEEKLGQIFGYFTFLAIFIACLGLFGLASFATEQRTKEIGIRKVLGASIVGIVLLLSKDFTKLVIVSNLIAWPIAYYAMNRWLQDFAYRINIGVGTFLLAGAIALIIALLTVGFQAVKAALANPVEALRYE